MNPAGGPDIIADEITCTKFDRYQIGKMGLAINTKLASGSLVSEGIYLQPLKVQCFSDTGCSATNLKEEYGASLTLDITT